MASYAHPTRYDLVKSAEGWQLKTDGRVVGYFETKAEALAHNSALERILEKLSGGEGTVRIHTELGDFEQELTYPLR